MSAVSSDPRDEQVVHVSGPRPGANQLAREILDVAAAVPLFATAPLVRHWHRRWGATDPEVAAVMPGDALVPGCQYQCTRAITIDAPPAAVWPWLVQVGFGKAGFYSNDLLDNVAHPSADRILDELQDPKVGDWVPMFSKVNGTTAFKIAAIKPAEELVWVKPDKHLGVDADRDRRAHPGDEVAAPLPLASARRRAARARAQRVRRLPHDAQDAPHAQTARRGGPHVKD